MKLIRYAACASLLLLMGCQTIIIRPATAPSCEIPAAFQNACSETARLDEARTYGDLPTLALNARKDFVECRKTYQEVLKSYEVCVAGLTRFNQSLKNLQQQTQSKYQGARLIEQD